MSNRKPIDPSAYPLIDCNVIQPSYVDGVGTIVQVGPVSHVSFTLLKPDSNKFFREVQIKLIIPNDELVKIAHMLAGAKATQADEDFAGHGIHAVN